MPAIMKRKSNGAAPSHGADAHKSKVSRTGPYTKPSSKSIQRKVPEPAPESESESSAGEEDEEEEENEEVINENDGEQTAKKTFADLGVREELCEACANLKFTHPTPIQEQSIPLALGGRDIIGLAETGSGKTAAFVLPILQSLMEKPQPLFGLVLAPTRELAFQISQQVEALGKHRGPINDLRDANCVQVLLSMSNALHSWEVWTWSPRQLL